MKINEQIPAGSSVPEPTGQTPENAPTSPAVKTEEVKSESVKDTSLMEKQLANLEKVIGRQGEELGQLRKEKESNAAPEQPNYDQMEANITEQLDSGELDLATAMKQISRLASQRGAEEAVSTIEQNQQRNQNEAAIGKFKQDNPDYDSVKASGVLDEIASENPLHDDFSAYLEYKRNELASSMEQQIVAAKQAGEQEGAALAAESGNAANVLGGRGNDVRDTIKQTNFTSRGQMKSAMSDALSKVRGG